ncbi:MAG TPA: SpoIIE family protein phosphatase, partial [Acidimicrobiales bacterium]|nr:SpoIIE family protein phosphatase [Acidimicrobiales bacterium]
AIVIADLDGTILACNQVATRTYGLSAGGAVGRPISDFFSGSSADDVRLVVDLVRRGETWAGDVPVARADGRTSWTYASVGPLRDENGVVVGIVASADDAQSEVRMLQRQASELSERLVLALAAGELGTWHRDMVTGLTEWDATLERIYGLAPGEFDGRYETFLELIHPEDVDRTREAVERAVANKSAYEVEHRVIWPDGTVHWVQGRGTITLGADGDVTGTIGCASDITARKRLEIEATRRYSQAEEAIRRERVLRERLEFLAELNRVAFAAPDYRSLMRAVTAAAVPELGDWCTLHFLPEPGGGAPEVEVAHRDPSKVEWAAQVRQRYPYDPDSPRGVPAVIRTGRLEFLREVDRESIEAAIVEAGASAIREELLALLDVLQLTSVITVPLNTKRRTIGAMQFVSAESGRVYDNEDVVLAQTAASRIAEALDNVWLTGQLREIASKLQASLLPPRLPQVPGISIAARYWAAGAMSEVGGDFYDAFAIDDHRWAVVIGDVCGTGPDGAAVTAIARHTIRAAATHGHPPEVVLSWLNDALHAGNRDLFCTVAYVTLEPLDGGRWRFTSTSAGHPFPVQVRRSGDATSVGIPGMLLGAIDSVTVHPVDGVLDVGDTLVLYTDGVTDVSPPYGIEPDELEKMAADAAAGEQSAESIAARFGDAIEEVLPISEREDDVALVVVHVI